jgi:hypothetical protein
MLFIAPKGLALKNTRRFSIPQHDVERGSSQRTRG